MENTQIWCQEIPRQVNSDQRWAWIAEAICECGLESNAVFSNRMAQFEHVITQLDKITPLELTVVFEAVEESYNELDEAEEPDEACEFDQVDEMLMSHGMDNPLGGMLIPVLLVYPNPDVTAFVLRYLLTLRAHVQGCCEESYALHSALDRLDLPEGDEQAC